ncbi:hypothetical protein CWI37_0117p0020 [Hamiltosporidium tvaerminnensis]|uniref:Leucine-rich repeat-containing protein n=1 Tax=Hamiltosporidium tvaerminnensis TaxID=1176355 RepID=A0A4Q9LA03_9MICR|nr:hypothetical protein CWI37_0117p0020 [Hamiltosporidium tvaerminnensis]
MNNFEDLKLYFMFNMLYYLILFQFIIANNFTYSFERNGNLEILFFRINKEESAFNTLAPNFCDLYISFHESFESNHEKTRVFTYEKNNFIGFEILNDFITSSKSLHKYERGIIQCNFELSYILRLSKDIAEIPCVLNNYQFSCILAVLKRLKAVENKRLFEFIKFLIITDFFLYNNCLNIQEIFDWALSLEINVQSSNIILSIIFNFLMLAHVFYDGNLIILENTSEIYDLKVFDTQVLYKSLLVNNIKVFYSLENALKNPQILETFKSMFSMLNIRSIVLYNNQRSKILESDFEFPMFKIDGIKSITIIDFREFSSSLFLKRLRKHIRKDLEVLKFQNTYIDISTLTTILKDQRFKKLVLNNGGIPVFFHLSNNFTGLNQSLKCIDFRNVTVDLDWWKKFFMEANVDKIIIHFSIQFAQDAFIMAFGFVPFPSSNNVTYFKVIFDNPQIPTSFFGSLSCLKNLRTLKISKYLVSEAIHSRLFEVIENFKVLKCLVLRKYGYSKKYYISLFKNPAIENLHLESIFQDSEIFIVDFLNYYSSLTKLVLINIMICQSSFIEIFELKKLTSLTYRSCIVEPKINSEPFCLKSKNISLLTINSNNLNDFKNIDLLSNLETIENLNLSLCNLPSGYLSKLSLLCNLSLKILSYEFNSLNLNDLQRMGKLETLEELNLRGCKFIRINFCKLNCECKFLYSLKKLDIWLVRINNEDLKFICNFRNLRNLTLTLSGLDLYALEDCLILLKIYQFSTHVNIADRGFIKLFGCLNEKGIRVIRI